MTASATSQRQRAGTEWILWLLVGVFVLVHVFFYWGLGLRFGDQLLEKAWQHLDTQLLKHDLLRSLFYLHSQPPLFNLFLGIILKLSSQHSTLLFQMSFLILGFTLYYLLFTMQVRLGVGRCVAFTLSTLFILSPSFITYENHLYYPFPVASILMVSAYLLHQFLVKQRIYLAAGFFFALFLLVGTRALYHLCYFIAILALLLVLLKPVRQKVLLAAALPFLLAFSLYFKNLVVFDHFVTSSWMGMNMSSLVSINYPIEDREQMISEGRLSKLAVANRFFPLNEYPPEYRDVAFAADVPALTQEIKPDGTTNLNHQAYLAISDQYLVDTLTLIKERPTTYLKSVTQAILIYHVPNVMFVPFNEDRDKTAFLENIYDTYFYGKLSFGAHLASIWPFSLIPGYPLHFFLILGLPFFLGYGLVLSLRKQAKSERLDRNQRIVILYMCLNIAYIAIVGNMFELGENSRFRFGTDAFYVALLGLFIQFCVISPLSRLLRSLRPRLAASGAERDGP